MNQDPLRVRAKNLQRWGLPLTVLAKVVKVSSTMVFSWAKGEKNLGEENYKKMDNVVQEMERIFEIQDK